MKLTRCSKHCAIRVTSESIDYINMYRKQFNRDYWSLVVGDYPYVRTCPNEYEELHGFALAGCNLTTEDNTHIITLEEFKKLTQETIHDKIKKIII